MAIEKTPEGYMSRALAGRNMTLFDGEMDILRLIEHRLDVWHKANTLLNKLHAVGSSKVAFRDIIRWCAYIHNHFWWSVQMCKGDSFVCKVSTMKISTIT